MKSLVLSIEQCRHLQELGLDMSDAVIYHIYETVQKERDGEMYEEDEWSVRPDNVYNLKRQPNELDYVPTYTLQEILENIPFEISDGKTRYELFIDYPHNTIFYYNFTNHKEYWSEQASSHRLIDSAYQMLVRYLTNK